MRSKLLLIPLAGLLAAATGCGSDNNTSSSSGAGTAAGVPACVPGTATASGSTALQPLVQAAADAYKASCSGAQITVSGGGSSTGLANVASGQSDIGDSDVPVSNAKSVDPNSVTDHQVAIVVFAVVVNKGAGVTALTTQQIVDIFSGKTTNWKDAGGNDVPVSLFERKAGSGTRLSFDKIIMKGTAESTNPAGTDDSTQVVVQHVGSAPGAVSYYNVANLPTDGSQVAVQIDGNAPTSDNVTGGKYPFYSHEHMYTKASGASQTALSFINFILSSDFQSSKVTALHFLPVSAQSAPSLADQ